MKRDSSAALQSTGFRDALMDLNQADRASWAIQRQLTARGVATVRMPRSAVVGFDGGPDSRLAFVGLQGPGTTLAGTSLAAHASSIAEVLEAKNLPVQPGRVCTTKQVQRAARYARSVGYPVIIRPANSDRAWKPRIVVRAAEKLPAALERIQIEASDRVVDRETGVRTAWIQKLPSGTLLRALVVGHEVVAAASGSPDTLGLETVKVEEIHPDIRATAVATLQALPGLEHGEVELVVQNLAEGKGSQNLSIMTVRSSPMIDTYRTSSDCGQDAAAALADYYIAKSSAFYSEPLDERGVEITYSGVVNQEKFVRRLKSRIDAICGSSGGIDAEIRSQGKVSVFYRGDPGIASLISLLGVRGLGQGQRASSVFTEINA